MIVIVLALFEAGRTVRSNRLLADRALRAYASFGAWKYQENIGEALRAAAQEILGSVNMFHTSDLIPSASSLAGRLVRDPGHPSRPAYGPVPAAFLRLRLRDNTLDVAPNGPMTISLGAADRRRWSDEMAAAARAPVSRLGYQVVITRAQDSVVALTLTRMPTQWGDTLVYAVAYDGATLTRLLAAAFDDPTLMPGATARGISNRRWLAVEVRDPGGRVDFASGAPEEWTRDVSVTMPATSGGLTIRTEVSPQAAGGIVIGGLPQSRIPTLAALLVLAIGLTAVAVVQLRREARFAHERTGFVASTSHELRTPLAQIRLVIDTLRLNREPDPARREASLALVDRELTRLQHLVDRILQFARNATDQRVSRQPANVGAEIMAVVSEFAPLARSRGVHLQVDAVPRSPEVLLEPGALRQVLLNLLDNAVKYGPEGQTIRIRVEVREDGGTLLRVSDEGPGVPREELERIWWPFERGSAADQRAVGGSGIGLTVVRQIVERHGGRATVTASNGTGASFVVEFPATR